MKLEHLPTMGIFCWHLEIYRLIHGELSTLIPFGDKMLLQ
jgi:hypothetical protein